MTVVEIAFWLCAGLLVYSLVGYPILLALLARLRPGARSAEETGDGPLPRVSVIVPAYAEAAVISDRIANLRGLEQITDFGGFTAFPEFSPDGRQLVFCSDRGAKERYEFNIFVADWQ